MHFSFDDDQLAMRDAAIKHLLADMYVRVEAAVGKEMVA